MTSTTNLSAPKAIMILDDETDIVYIFRKSLELTGYGVFAFTDPMIALDHFKSNVDRYGLIVTDVRMPNMTGIEFAQEIRSLNSDVAIILMSAFDMKDLGISPSLKIAELLQKPVTPSQLKDVVSKYVVAVSNSTTSLPTNILHKHSHVRAVEHASILEEKKKI